MKRQQRLDPEKVFLGCSTTKKSYENLFQPEQLKEIREYQHICEQMKEMTLKYPSIKVELQRGI